MDIRTSDPAIQNENSTTMSETQCSLLKIQNREFSESKRDKYH